MIEYESQLLRLLTLRPSELLECGQLEPRHFLDMRYRRVYEAISKLYDDGKKVSLTGVSVEIGEDWVQDTLIPLAKIRVDGTASTLCDAIIDAYAARQAMQAVGVYKDAITARNGQREAITELATALLDIANDKSKSNLTNGDIVADRVLDIIRNPDVAPQVIKSGIFKFDEKIGGFQKSLLTVISGVPGMGKSALLVNLIMNFALAGNHVHVGSLEDKSLYVLSRALGRLAGVNTEPIIKSQKLGFEEIQKIEMAVEKNREALSRIHIDDSTGQGFMSIRRTCMKLRSAGECDVSVIDHLGELKKMSQREYTAATLNVEGIRDMAADLDIPVLLACQVSKDAVKSAAGAVRDHTAYIPRPSHLRDSGRITEAARMICFVHRPHVWDDNEPEEDFWLCVPKQSHGRTGIVKLGSHLQTMSIYSPNEPQEEY